MSYSNFVLSHKRRARDKNNRHDKKCNNRPCGTIGLSTMVHAQQQQRRQQQHLVRTQANFAEGRACGYLAPDQLRRCPFFSVATNQHHVARPDSVRILNGNVTWYHGTGTRIAYLCRNCDTCVGSPGQPPPASLFFRIMSAAVEPIAHRCVAAVLG